MIQLYTHRCTFFLKSLPSRRLEWWAGPPALWEGGLCRPSGADTAARTAPNSAPLRPSPPPVTTGSFSKSVTPLLVCNKFTCVTVFRFYM